MNRRVILSLRPVLAVLACAACAGDNQERRANTTVTSSPTYGESAVASGSSPAGTQVSGAIGDHSGSTTTSNPNVDNTAMNRRDQSGNTVTPDDQGSSQAETDITARIRRGMMSDRTLSFTARNVKVVTVGSTVTLRGPVMSQAEHDTIVALARQTPGVTQVDDRLEVKR